MTLPTVEQLGPLKDRRVLVNCNFDVAVEGDTIDSHATWRVEASLPLLNMLAQQGAKVSVCSYRGRPKGEDVTLSMRPIQQYIADVLERRVLFGDAEPQAGEMVIRENVRFDVRETQNDENFAKELASQGDVFINNNFATAHRAYASVVGVPRHLPSAAGPLLIQEVTELSAVRDYTGEGLVVVMGGAKAQTKITLVEYFLERGGTVLVGGVLANTLLREQGFGVGVSLVDDESDLLNIDLEHPRLILPVDVVVSRSFEKSLDQAMRAVGEVQSDEAIVDVGPQTQKLFADHMHSARLAVWNGPLGLVEVEAFRTGSCEFAKVFTEGSAKTVTGGGDIVRFLSQEERLSHVDHVSTGGGAMLLYLTGERLPGLEALRQR